MAMGTNGRGGSSASKGKRASKGRSAPFGQRLFSILIAVTLAMPTMLSGIVGTAWADEGVTAPTEGSLVPGAATPATTDASSGEGQAAGATGEGSAAGATDEGLSPTTTEESPDEGLASSDQDGIGAITAFDAPYAFTLATTDIAPAVAFSAADVFPGIDGARISAHSVADPAVAQATRNATTGVVSVTGLKAGSTTIAVSATVGSDTYEGTVNVQVDGVYDLSLLGIKLPQAKFVWNGVAVTPRPTIAKRSTALVEGADYALYYANNNRIGTASVVVVGLGDYAGSVPVTCSYEISKASLYLVGYRLWDANWDMTADPPAEITGTLDNTVLQTPGDAN
ncbi:MAG: hypothetical protein LBG81_04035, partial [Coriobacteriaceae bacterium]|nr:hypothetical protein [Coriobacteriaceae bacterium]